MAQSVLRSLPLGQVGCDPTRFALRGSLSCGPKQKTENKEFIPFIGHLNVPTLKGLVGEFVCVHVISVL